MRRVLEPRRVKQEDLPGLSVIPTNWAEVPRSRLTEHGARKIDNHLEALYRCTRMERCLKQIKVGTMQVTRAYIVLDEVGDADVVWRFVALTCDLSKV